MRPLKKGGGGKVIERSRKENVTQEKQSREKSDENRAYGKGQQSHVYSHSSSTWVKQKNWKITGPGRSKGQRGFEERERSERTKKEKKAMAKLRQIWRNQIGNKDWRDGQKTIRSGERKMY